MPSKIRVLSDHTINKIAAGEVIENPSSVVKELVENALDAGATDICVEIQGGGRQLIRITDNGCGMNSDDALLCLERHATSKIREVEEIHEIATMGFRGEAIPSIASISKFNLLTCPAQEPNAPPPKATLIIVDGGKVVSSSPAARSQGTTVEVKQLFFNVPVRKKFLKSPAIDANEIHKTLSLISLGYPSIKFQLINDGKTELMAPAPTQNTFKEQLKERIHTILGNDYLHNCTYIEAKNPSCTLTGFVGNPGYTRHNRTGQYLFINQRGVASPTVSFAVRDGYGTALPTGRHPVFVLHLTLDGSLVDVNVHPQKREVRLRQEQLIRDQIIKAITTSLHRPTPTPAPEYTETPQPLVSPVFAAAFTKSDPSPAPVPHRNDDAWVFKPKAAPATPTHTQQPLFTQRPEPAAPEPTYTPPPRVLATIPRFILIDATIPHNFISKGCSESSTGGLLLVNQRAAHARIIFEKLANSTAAAPIAQQPLLIPLPIEVSPFETAMIKSNLPHLNKLGIILKEFGTHTFLLEALPQVFGTGQAEQLIKDLIHTLRDGGESQSDEARLKQIAQAASRSAVASDRRLTLDEAQSLLNQLSRCQNPYLCPSGKRIIAQITPEELAKLFNTPTKGAT